MIYVGIVLIIAILAGYWQIRKLGKVTVPNFEEIGENTYAYSESINRTNMYLLLGEEKAMLIDTGNGLSYLPVGISKITGLPVIVVNTHGHYDHTRGNHFFDETYMSVKDNEVYENHKKPETVEWLFSVRVPGLLKGILKYHLKTVNETPIKEDYLPLPDEGYFDLGNRKLKIIELPGHTPGSIGLLDTQTGALFTGDAITTTGVLLDLEESLPMSTHVKALQSVQEMISSGMVTKIHGGHAAFGAGTDIVQKFLAACYKINSGNLTDKEKADGRIIYNGLNISFDLNKLSE